MAEKRFHEPRVKIDRVYTRGGDQGKTSLVGGKRVAKDSARLEAYGTVDELNSAIGLATVALRELNAATPELASLAQILLRIQHELFNLGAALATPPALSAPDHPCVTARDVRRLEEEMDACMAVLAPLRAFVLPGGSRLSAALHLARTICRRAERRCVALADDVGRDVASVPRRGGFCPDRPEDDICADQGMPLRYLNRLSDALFVFSRWADHLQQAAEILWDPNQAASGQMDPKNR